MKYILITALLLFIGINASTATADPITWMLMEAPSHTDMDVENYSYQINGAVSLEDCLEMKSTYFDDKHHWCEELNQILEVQHES